MQESFYVLLGLMGSQLTVILMTHQSNVFAKLLTGWTCFVHCILLFFFLRRFSRRTLTRIGVFIGCLHLVLFRDVLASSHDLVARRVFRDFHTKESLIGYVKDLSNRLPELLWMWARYFIGISLHFTVELIKQYSLLVQRYRDLLVFLINHAWTGLAIAAETVAVYGTIVLRIPMNLFFAMLEVVSTACGFDIQATIDIFHAAFNIVVHLWELDKATALLMWIGSGEIDDKSYNQVLAFMFFYTIIVYGLVLWFVVWILRTVYTLYRLRREVAKEVEEEEEEESSEEEEEEDESSEEEDD